MKKNSMRRLSGYLLLSLVMSQSVRAQEAAFITMAEDERRQWIIDQASEYEIRIVDQSQALRCEEPVLRFNDNVSGVVDAVQFVWTINGRPEASASFWYRKDGLKAHEFISLSRNSIEATRDDSVAWESTNAGLSFKAVAGAPVPAIAKAARLTQMRQISRRCEAAENTKSGELNLRLMSQPIVRYEPQAKEILDGAIFSFSKGTNPEVLLVVEAIVDDKGNKRFEYAPARMTSRACWLLIDGHKVWSVGNNNGRKLTGRYRNVYAY